MERKFVAYFYCNGLDHISLGFHIDWEQPNIEIHVPFGFFRIGWTGFKEYNKGRIQYRGFGYNTGD